VALLRRDGSLAAVGRPQEMSERASE